MTEWYLMGKVPVFYSGGEKEDFDNYAQDGFLELLETTGKIFELCNSDLSVCKEVKGILQNRTADTKLRTLERQVLLPIGTCKAGMYLKYKNRYWIICGIVDDNDMYEKAVIVICQHKLRFQNETGDIIERYTNVVSASQYNNGETGNKTITLGSDQLMLLLPQDDITIELASPKRFFIHKSIKKPIPYIITRNDTVIYDYGDSGCVNLVVTQDVLNEATDNLDLMLCDYTPPSPTLPDENEIPNSSYSKITYKSLPELKLGGNTKSFTVTFYDENNNVLTNFTPKWQIKSDFDGVVLINTDNVNTIKLKVDGDYDLIGKTFTLEVSDVSGGNLSLVAINIVGLM